MCMKFYFKHSSGYQKFFFSIKSNSVHVYRGNWLFLEKESYSLCVNFFGHLRHLSIVTHVSSLLLKVYFFPCSRHQGLRISAIRMGREIEPSGLERSSERIRFIALPFVNHATRSRRREEKFEVSRATDLPLAFYALYFRC